MGNFKHKAGGWVPLCWTIIDRELELYQERLCESSGAADHEENTKEPMQGKHKPILDKYQQHHNSQPKHLQREIFSSNPSQCCQQKNH